MRRQVVLLAVGLTAFVHTQATIAASFTGLGYLTGYQTSTAYGVSADGSTVVGQSSGSLGPEAFRWTAANGMIGLGYLQQPGGILESTALATSADGSVVVGASYKQPSNEAFRWTSATGMVSLGDLPGSSLYSVAFGASADASVVVGTATGLNGHQAALWTGGGIIEIGPLESNHSSHGSGVSADGSVVIGGGGTSLGHEAFVWTSATGIVGLGDLPGGGFQSYAYDVSADGLVVIGSGVSDAGREAMRWTSAGGMVGLGDLPGGFVQADAYGVSGDGSIVVGRGAIVGAFRGFIWDSAHGMRNLQDVLENDYGLGPALAGWTLTEARSISDDGRVIVGTGASPTGTQAWIAVIPEPSTFALAWSAAVFMTFLGWHGRRRVGSPTGRIP